MSDLDLTEEALRRLGELSHDELHGFTGWMCGKYPAEVLEVLDRMAAFKGRVA